MALGDVVESVEVLAALVLGGWLDAAAFDPFIEGLALQVGVDDSDLFAGEQRVWVLVWRFLDELTVEACEVFFVAVDAALAVAVGAEDGVGESVGGPFAFEHAAAVDAWCGFVLGIESDEVPESFADVSDLLPVVVPR